MIVKIIKDSIATFIIAFLMASIFVGAFAILQEMLSFFPIWVNGIISAFLMTVVFTSLKEFLVRRSKK